MINKLITFTCGAVIGTLGGLIGLGGAEFRLPLLIGLFHFAALDAIILNKAMSLVVVMASLVFRTKIIPFDQLSDHADVILNLLAGSLVGAWLGAGWAIRIKSTTLYKTIAILLILIALVLLFGHWSQTESAPLLSGSLQTVLGIFAGFGIGVVASLLGVAGGELLIPTLILLFGIDIKLAGSLSLAISLPTMLTGFARYSRDKSFTVIKTHADFALIMASGSLLGAFCGGLLLGIIPNTLLLPTLSVILVLSAIKVWMHR